MSILSDAKELYKARIKNSSSEYDLLNLSTNADLVSCSPNYLLGKSSNVETQLQILYTTINNEKTCFRGYAVPNSAIVSPFKLYGNETDRPRVVRYGQYVCLYGVLGTTAAVTASSGQVIKMFSIPAEYAPPKGQAIDFVCQGSGINRWLLHIWDDGTVNICRYGSTSYINIPSGVWLPFCASWISQFPSSTASLF